MEGMGQTTMMLEEDNTSTADQRPQQQEEQEEAMQQAMDALWTGLQHRVAASRRRRQQGIDWHQAVVEQGRHVLAAAQACKSLTAPVPLQQEHVQLLLSILTKMQPQGAPSSQAPAIAIAIAKMLVRHVERPSSNRLHSCLADTQSAQGLVACAAFASLHQLCRDVLSAASMQDADQGRLLYLCLRLRILCNLACLHQDVHTDFCERDLGRVLALLLRLASSRHQHLVFEPLRAINQAVIACNSVSLSRRLRTLRYAFIHTQLFVKCASQRDYTAALAAIKRDLRAVEKEAVSALLFCYESFPSNSIRAMLPIAPRILAATAATRSATNASPSTTAPTATTVGSSALAMTRATARPTAAAALMAKHSSHLSLRKPQHTSSTSSAASIAAVTAPVSPSHRRVSTSGSTYTTSPLSSPSRTNHHHHHQHHQQQQQQHHHHHQQQSHGQPSFQAAARTAFAFPDQESDSGAADDTDADEEWNARVKRTRAEDLARVMTQHTAFRFLTSLFHASIFMEGRRSTPTATAASQVAPAPLLTFAAEIITIIARWSVNTALQVIATNVKTLPKPQQQAVLTRLLLNQLHSSSSSSASSAVSNETAVAMIEALSLSLHVCIRTKNVTITGDVVRLHGQVLHAWRLWQLPAFRPHLSRYEAVVLEALMMLTTHENAAGSRTTTTTTVPASTASASPTTTPSPRETTEQPATQSTSSTPSATNAISSSSSPPPPPSSSSSSSQSRVTLASADTCRLLLLLEPCLAADRAQRETALLSPRRLRALLSVDDDDVLRLIIIRLADLDEMRAIAALTTTAAHMLQHSDVLNACKQRKSLEKCISVLVALVQGQHTASPVSNPPHAGSVMAVAVQVLLLLFPQQERNRCSGGQNSNNDIGSNFDSSHVSSDGREFCVLQQLCLHLLRLSALHVCTSASDAPSSPHPRAAVSAVVDALAVLLSCDAREMTSTPSSSAPSMATPTAMRVRPLHASTLPRDVILAVCAIVVSPTAQLSASYEQQQTLLDRAKWLQHNSASINLSWEESSDNEHDDNDNIDVSSLTEGGAVLLVCLLHACAPLLQAHARSAVTMDAISMLLRVLAAAVPLLHTCALVPLIETIGDTLCCEYAPVLACPRHHCHTAATALLCACVHVSVSPRALHSLLSLLDSRWPTASNIDCLDEVAHHLVHEPQHFLSFPAQASHGMRVAPSTPTRLACEDGHTLMAWVKLGSRPPPNTPPTTILEMTATTDASNRGSGVAGTRVHDGDCFHVSIAFGADGRLMYRLMVNNNVIAQETFVDGAVSLHEWHHIAVTHERSDVVALFVDGFLVSTATVAYPPFLPPPRPNAGAAANSRVRTPHLSQLSVLSSTAQPEHARDSAAGSMRSRDAGEDTVSHLTTSAASTTAAASATTFSGSNNNIPAGPIGQDTRAHAPLSAQVSQLCVGLAFVLTAPITAAQAHAVYMQGPNHVSFGACDAARTEDVLASGHHLIATSLNRLLKHHRVASLRALQAVMCEPPMMDDPFDTTQGVKTLRELVPRIACMLKPSEDCAFFNQSNVLVKQTISVSPQWRWMTRTTFAASKQDENVTSTQESTQSHTQKQQQQQRARGSTVTTTTTLSSSSSSTVITAPTAATFVGGGATWDVLSRLRTLHHHHSSSNNMPSAAAAAAATTTSRGVAAAPMTSAPVRVTRSQLTDSLVHIGGLPLLFYALGAAGPCERTQSSLVRTIINVQQKNTMLSNEFKSLRGLHLLADFLRSPRAVISDAMLDAIVGGAMCMQSPMPLHTRTCTASSSPSPPSGGDGNTDNATPASASVNMQDGDSNVDDTCEWRSVTHVERGIMVQPSIIKHCLLDFRIWRRARVSTWCRTLALCTAFISPSHCKFHTLNLLQLRSVNVVERCLMRWQEDDDLRWPGAVALRAVAFINHALAGAEETAEDLRSLMQFLIATHKSRRTQVRTQTVALCGRMRRRKRRNRRSRFSSTPAAPSGTTTAAAPSASMTSAVGSNTATTSNSSTHANAGVRTATTHELVSAASMPVLTHADTPENTPPQSPSSSTTSSTGKVSLHHHRHSRRSSDSHMSSLQMPSLIEVSELGDDDDDDDDDDDYGEGDMDDMKVGDGGCKGDDVVAVTKTMDAAEVTALAQPDTIGFDMERDVDRDISRVVEQQDDGDDSAEWGEPPRLTPDAEGGGGDALSDAASSVSASTSASAGGVQIVVHDAAERLAASPLHTEAAYALTREDSNGSDAAGTHAQSVTESDALSSSLPSVTHDTHAHPHEQHRHAVSSGDSAGVSHPRSPSTYGEWVAQLAAAPTALASPRLGLLGVLYRRVRALLNASLPEDMIPAAAAAGSSRDLASSSTPDTSASTPPTTGTNPTTPTPLVAEQLPRDAGEFVRESINAVLRPPVLLALANSTCAATRLAAVRLIALAVHHRLPSMRRLLHRTSSASMNTKSGNDDKEGGVHSLDSVDGNGLALLALQLSLHSITDEIAAATLDLFADVPGNNDHSIGSNHPAAVVLAGDTHADRERAAFNAGVPQHNSDVGWGVRELGEDITNANTWVQHVAHLMSTASSAHAHASGPSTTTTVHNSNNSHGSKLNATSQSSPRHGRGGNTGAACVVATVLGACDTQERVERFADRLRRIITSNRELAAALLNANTVPVVCDVSSRLGPVPSLRRLLCSVVSNTVCVDLLAAGDKASVENALAVLETVLGCIATSPLKQAAQCTLHLAVVSQVVDDVCAPAFLPRARWLCSLGEEACHAQLLVLAKVWDAVLEVLLFHFNHKARTPPTTTAADSTAASDTASIQTTTGHPHDALNTSRHSMHSDVAAYAAATTAAVDDDGHHQEALRTFALSKIAPLKLLLLRVFETDLAASRSLFLQSAGRLVAFLLFRSHGLEVHEAVTALLDSAPLHFLQTVAEDAPDICAQIAYGVHRLRRVWLRHISHATTDRAGASSNSNNNTNNPTTTNNNNNDNNTANIHGGDADDTSAAGHYLSHDGGDYRTDVGSDVTVAVHDLLRSRARLQHEQEYDHEYDFEFDPRPPRAANSGGSSSSGGGGGVAGEGDAGQHAGSSSHRSDLESERASGIVHVADGDLERFSALTSTLTGVWRALVPLSRRRFARYFDAVSVDAPHAVTSVAWHSPAFANKRVVCRLNGIMTEHAGVHRLYIRKEHARQEKAKNQYRAILKRASDFEDKAITLQTAASRNAILDLRRRRQRAAQVRAVWRRVDDTCTVQPSPWYRPPPRALWMLDATEDPTRRRPKLAHCPWLPGNAFRHDDDPATRGTRNASGQDGPVRDGSVSDFSRYVSAVPCLRGSVADQHEHTRARCCLCCCCHDEGDATPHASSAGAMIGGAIDAAGRAIAEVMDGAAFAVDVTTLSQHAAAALVVDLVHIAVTRKGGSDMLSHANADADARHAARGGARDDNDDDEGAYSLQSLLDVVKARVEDAEFVSAVLRSAVAWLESDNLPPIENQQQQDDTAGDSAAHNRGGSSNDDDGDGGEQGGGEATEQVSLLAYLIYAGTRRDYASGGGGADGDGEHSDAPADNDERTLAEGDMLTDAVRCTLVSPFASAEGELLLGQRNLYFKASSPASPAAAAMASLGSHGHGSPGDNAATSGGRRNRRRRRRHPHQNVMMSLTLLESLNEDPSLLPFWPLSGLMDVQPRRYMLKHTAIEVFFADGRTVMCDVHVRTKRDALLAKLARVAAEANSIRYSAGAVSSDDKARRPGRIQRSNSANALVAGRRQGRALHVHQRPRTFTSPSDAARHHQQSLQATGVDENKLMAGRSRSRPSLLTSPQSSEGGGNKGTRRTSWHVAFLRRLSGKFGAGDADAHSDDDFDESDTTSRVSADAGSATGSLFGRRKLSDQEDTVGTATSLASSTTTDAGAVNADDAWTLSDKGNPSLHESRSKARIRQFFTSVSTAMQGRPVVALGSADEMNAVHTLLHRWREGSITNFEYIMSLNTLAGRTFNDLGQYPVFPHVIADYESSHLDLTRTETFRDLSKPIGALDERRVEKVKDQYQDQKFEYNMLDATQFPFMHGTHYSSAGAVMYYLSRLEPFSQLAKDLQGGRFDVADRLFSSVQQAWAIASGPSADVKELIPEFFYLPEFLVNVNGYDMGTRQNTADVGDVELPPWANNSPRVFVRTLAAALESEHVSAHLHEWIDLVFGFKQQGEAAEAAVNVFHPFCYEGELVESRLGDAVQRDAVTSFIRHFGQTPAQLFSKPHPPRFAQALTPTTHPLLQPPPQQPRAPTTSTQTRSTSTTSRSTESTSSASTPAASLVFASGSAGGAGLGAVRWRIVEMPADAEAQRLLITLHHMQQQQQQQQPEHGHEGRGVDGSRGMRNEKRGGAGAVLRAMLDQTPAPVVSEWDASGDTNSDAGGVGGGGSTNSSVVCVTESTRVFPSPHDASADQSLTYGRQQRASGSMYPHVGSKPSSTSNSSNRGGSAGDGDDDDGGDGPLSVCIDARRGFSLKWNCWDDALLLVNDATHGVEATLPHNSGGRMTCMGVCPSLSCAVAGYSSGVVRFVGFDTAVADGGVMGAWRRAPQLWRVSDALAHAGAVTSVVCNSALSFAVTASEDCTAQLWDLSKKRLVRTLAHREAVRHCATSGTTGDVVTVTAGAAWRVHLWSVNGQFVGEWALPAGVAVTCVAMTAYPMGCTSNAVLVGRSDGAVSILSMLDLSHVRDLWTQHAASVTRMRLTSHSIITDFEDGAVVQWWREASNHSEPDSSEA
ncbi:beige/BEACH domain-containing protein [Salpingoeca rosetta]|uniref:Beige/BEACH domain-containing protein n=1 Tax=Salpingoeca rosetta (strain ATCC 50818 / BSB-021) TaxID=946362 RepID=F2UKN4_SALR5|nr:beige/BEACH domain-containing protein [Salpingoeca rosetta]EGD77683.1 beige/BEACH domain-containing protein [Salpingoeca rosetta]|eukprot:XP_004990159.1 beige/BEACH domain-containing protein [Salpingoeca rosetta]